MPVRGDLILGGDVVAAENEDGRWPSRSEHVEIPAPSIAQLVAADTDTVRNVIHDFNARSPAALGPNWMGSRPRRTSPDDIAFIVATARTLPPGAGLPSTRWSLRTLAAHLHRNPQRRERACTRSLPPTLGPTTSSLTDPANVPGHRTSGHRALRGGVLPQQGP
ncbi:helix-turn-helix domain-containing protein [Saccharothrix sp. BKS2]